MEINRDDRLISYDVQEIWALSKGRKVTNDLQPSVQ